MTTYPQVFCVASVLIERLIQLDLSPKKYKAGKKVTVEAAGKSKKYEKIILCLFDMRSFPP
jgi:hypothetical protein